MAAFEIPEKYKTKYDTLEMEKDDWNSLKEEISPSCFHWAWIQYLKRQYQDVQLRCNEMGCLCSYFFIGNCCVDRELYCSHQYLEGNRIYI